MNSTGRHPRDFALKVELPPGAGPITEMIPRKGGLEVMTRDATYAVVMPDEMDQMRKIPNMPPAIKKLASVGSSSPLVARIYLQSRQIMGNFPLKHEAGEEVLEHFHACKDAMLQADQIASDLLGDYEPLWAAANGQGFPKVGGAIIAPHIEGLDLRTANFTGHAKRAVQAVGDAFNSFYGLTLADGPVKNGNFNFARAFLAKQPTPSLGYLKLLDDSREVTHWVIRARNGFEHPGPDTLEIRNFEIRERTVIAPLWNFPDEKPTSVIGDLREIMSSLVQFAEHNFFFGFLDNVSVALPMRIISIPENEINPECPICYRLDIIRE